MKNKTVRGILALVVVTALSFGVIIGSRALSKDMEGSLSEGETSIVKDLDVSGWENIQEASQTENGYMVTVKEKGYGGDILMNVSFDHSKEVLTQVQVLEQSETEGLGAKITEPEFLDQFPGKKAPVVFADMDSQEKKDEIKELEDDLAQGAVLADGTYEAKTQEPDGNGFTDQVTMTVEGGKITQVAWESIGEDGSKKSVLSENGEYVMTEDGPTWKEQAEALAKAVVENQSLSFLAPNEEGKTDAVAGVSISVNGFIDLTQECMEQAAGIEKSVQEDSASDDSGEAAGETAVDAVAGATVSSTAAITAINEAYEFLQTAE